MLTMGLTWVIFKLCDCFEQTSDERPWGKELREIDEWREWFLSDLGIPIHLIAEEIWRSKTVVENVIKCEIHNLILKRSKANQNYPKEIKGVSSVLLPLKKNVYCWNFLSFWSISF